MEIEMAQRSFVVRPKHWWQWINPRWRRRARLTEKLIEYQVQCAIRAGVGKRLLEAPFVYRRKAP